MYFNDMLLNCFDFSFDSLDSNWCEKIMIKNVYHILVRFKLLYNIDFC